MFRIVQGNRRDAEDAEVRRELSIPDLRLRKNLAKEGNKKVESGSNARGPQQVYRTGNEASHVTLNVGGEAK